MPASPHLNPDRFADLTTAIKAMAKRPRSRQLPEEWATILIAKPKTADSWAILFAEHPDLFRLRDDGHIVLRDRHYLPPFTNTKTGQAVTQVEFDKLSGEERKVFDRAELSKEDIDSVLKSAERVQDRSIAVTAANRTGRQSWIALGAGLAGSAIGYVVKTFLG